MTATASQPSPARMPAPGDTWLFRCCERGWLPDPLIRAGMRTLDRDQRVSYELEQDRRGKMSAVNLQSA